MRHVLHLMQRAGPGGRGGDEGGPTGPCAFPATDGSADLRLPPPRSAIIALHQLRFFGRNAQIADAPGWRGEWMRSKSRAARVSNREQLLAPL